MDANAIAVKFVTYQATELPKRGRGRNPVDTNMTAPNNLGIKLDGYSTKFNFLQEIKYLLTS